MLIIPPPLRAYSAANAAFAVVLLAAWAYSPGAPPTLVEPPSVALAAPSAAEDVDDVAPVAQDVRAVWSDVAVTEGCWFFSAPAPYGRDHAHGAQGSFFRDGDSAMLTFGTADFAGLVTKTDDVVLYHIGEGTGNGAPWHYTETIAGKMMEGVLVASYSYRECVVGANGNCTESGRCRVTASVRIDSAR